MLLRIGSAAAWSLKPLLDFMVLLLTVYKSAKFRRVPRPVLIDVLIADGMNPRWLDHSELRLIWLYRDPILRVRMLRRHPIRVKITHLGDRASVVLNSLSIFFCLVGASLLYFRNDRSRVALIVGPCTLKFSVRVSSCSPGMASLTCERLAHR